MEQLIFVGLLVLFSVLEAVARKGKERQGGEEELPLPEAPPRRAPPPQPRPAPSRSGPPTYDEDPSFDDRVEGRGVRPAPPPEVKESRAPAGGKGSEGLIPADVWEEIQALARGEAPRTQPAPQPRPVPVPRPVERRPVPVERTEARPAPTRMPSAPKPVQRPSRPLPRPEVEVAASGAAVAEPVHAVHLTHPKYGTAVGGRLTGFAEDVRAPVSSRDGLAVRQMLKGGPSRLRQAVILQELLGPPVGLREEG